MQLFLTILDMQVKNKAELVSHLQSIKYYIPHQVCEAINRLAADDLLSSTNEVSIENVCSSIRINFFVFL